MALGRAARAGRQDTAGPPGGPLPQGPGDLLDADGPEPFDDYADAGGDEREDLFRALVRSVDGERVGRVTSVVRDEGGRPTWLVVSTGWLRGADVPVPYDEGCRRRGGTVVVPYPKDVVRDAPPLDPDLAVDPQLETGVRLHYAAARASLLAGRSGPAETPWPCCAEDRWDDELGDALVDELRGAVPAQPTAASPRTLAAGAPTAVPAA